MLQRLMEAAADADAQTVIAQLQEGPGLTPWFLCHVSDMLATAGSQARAMLRRPLEFHGCTQVIQRPLDFRCPSCPAAPARQLVRL